MAQEQMPHDLTLRQRQKLALTGVTEVISSEDKQVILNTCDGRLKVSGASLSIGKLNVETGELSLCGTVNFFEYKDIKNKGDFFSSMFK